jgi:DNA-directed RNA polymerase I subunit RPA1
MRVSQDITRRLDGILFGFYSAEEVRKMSAVEVTRLTAFDQFGTPLKDGLYDPRMGVSPYERHTRCVTCGQEEDTCPGHPGHIELIVPVYNVFLVSQLHKVLRAKCLSCHKVKATEARAKQYKIMFSLLKFGRLTEFEQYKRLCEIKIPPKYRQEKRKDSQSTRRPSDSSEGTDMAIKEKDKEKEKEDALREMLQNLEKNAQVEKKRIAGLLNVKDNVDLYKDGFDNNAWLAAQHRYSKMT